MEHQLGTTYHPVSRVSYRAIVGGAITFLICLAIVLALGAGLGLSAYGATTAETGRVFGERLWFVFALCCAGFCGGYVASVISRCVTRRDGALHGILAWGLAGLFVFARLTLFGGARDRGTLPVADLGAEGMAWALFAGLVLAFGLSMLAGILGARSEARAAGLPEPPVVPEDLEFKFRGFRHHGRHTHTPTPSPT